MSGHEGNQRAGKAVAAPTSCGECGLALRWEPIEDSRGGTERWLAVCACGMPTVFFPGRPGHRPADPLREGLLDGAATPSPTPPWIRLFQLSSRHPWWLPWRHVPRACGCGQRVTFAVWTLPARGRRAYSQLCLACGRATSEHLRADAGLREAPVTGTQWSPPCVAVARLRRAVFCDPYPGDEER